MTKQKIAIENMKQRLGIVQALCICAFVDVTVTVTVAIILQRQHSACR